MHHEPPINDATIPRRVQVNLLEVGQLFITMDHSPFHERDLLYDWWPLRRRGWVYEKLSPMRVEVRKGEG
jgi:hypothetical protein